MIRLLELGEGVAFYDAQLRATDEFRRLISTQAALKEAEEIARRLSEAAASARQACATKAEEPPPPGTPLEPPIASEAEGDEPVGQPPIEKETPGDLVADDMPMELPPVYNGRYA